MDFTNLTFEGRVSIVLIVIGLVCVLSYFFEELPGGWKARKEMRRSLVVVGIVLIGIGVASATVSGSVEKDAPHPKESAFPLQAVIDDPDGYTNIRSMRTGESEVVAKVRDGEIFFTRQQEGNWWQVRTVEGKVGYMHVSRIKLRDETNH